MKNVSMELLVVACSLFLGASVFGQELEPRQAYAGWFSRHSSPPAEKANCCGSCGATSGGDRCCFPRNACPDDYCDKPFPRQCWPDYPPFYRCVPAGDCAGYGNGKENLTWWFIPKPQALREALWLKGR